MRNLAHSMGFKTIEPDSRFNIQRNLINMESNVSDISEDSNIWVDQEIQQLLSVIDVMSLSNDLAGGNFASTAIDAIKNGLSMAGYHKSYKQVENVLMSLKMAYLNSREALSQGIHNDTCPYYDSLERIWSSRNNSNSNKGKMDEVDENMHSKSICTSRLLRVKMSNQKSPLWSDDETLELLNLIVQMNLITDFRHRLSPTTIKTLVIPLANRGYTRTCNQIIGKMRSMRENYLRCVRAGRTSQAVNNCPFFKTMDRMFQRLLINNDLSSLQPIDHDYENKFTASINSLDTDTQILNESAPTWQPIEPLAGYEGTSLQSVETRSNDKTDENLFGGDTFENGQSDRCDNNSIEIGNNLDVYLDSSTDCRTVDDQRNGSYLLRNHIDIPKVDKKQLKTRIFRSDIPKYIRIVKGKSKYILKKIDAPKHIKSEPTASYERSHSPIKKSNCQPMELSPSDTDKPVSPIRITMTKKLKNKAVPFNKSPLDLDPTCSRTDLINSNSLSETMKTIMEQILNHQEQMQQQHHKWMEKQFEIQREHECEQRQFLLDELREFRKELRDVTEQLFTD